MKICELFLKRLKLFINMKNKKKKVGFWIALAFVAIIAMFVIFNWEAFASGFEAGRALAE
jgi:hypothetical protein